ncbi:MAG: sulfotransferase family protein [Acidobacteriota bacterium]
MQRAPLQEDDLIFVCGFARAGTSWLRDCVASHPDVSRIPSEIVYRPDARTRVQMLLARRLRPINQRLAGFLSLQNTKGSAQNGRDEFLAEILDSIDKHKLPGPRFVSKAPANSMHLATLCRLFPHSKFLFIIRDPRDVLVSHQRGNRRWMEGANSTVEDCMEITEKYFRGYLEAEGLPNVFLIRYEDLHQDFHATLAKLYEFIGVSSDQSIIEEGFNNNRFASSTGRCYTEDRDAAARKGVVGDWSNLLAQSDLDWYKTSVFWATFMQRFDYDWSPVTYESIVTAMMEAGVHFIDEEELLEGTLDTTRPNVLLLHDIDLVDRGNRRNSILATARIEGVLGIPSIFNFLPLDDPRYRGTDRNGIVELIDELKRLSPASIGLHFNGTERFFPAGMESVGSDHPDIQQAIEYLHTQLDDYASYGITFRTGTAHGYGRGVKEPNNTSAIFRQELGKRGIRLFDNDLRLELKEKAAYRVRMHDVGGPITVWRFPTAGKINVANTYRQFDAGSLINFLTHPGNYDMLASKCMGLRINERRKRILAEAV